MIKDIRIKNYKCFENLHLEMSSLNVFAGINSMGKSTAIQVILLLRQAYEMGVLDKGIYLNGNQVKLGTGYDILYRDSQEDVIGIIVEADEGSVKCEYEYLKNSDYQTIKSFEDVHPEDINIFKSGFSYISAERLGPQRYYENSYRDVVEKDNIGTKGEYYASYLTEKGLSEKIDNVSVLHPTSHSDLLIYQVEAWLSELSPGIRLNPAIIQDAGIVSMTFGEATQHFLPMNVGFGLSYVAPIVVALLKAKRNDLIILENPEAHLHPRGQRKLGELIARVASGGVQIIVETHSDHLLNGIRIAVKTKIICNADIRLNYFFYEAEKKFGSGIRHIKCSPTILDDGSLSDWPEGFFDEWDKALEELF